MSEVEARLLKYLEETKWWAATLRTDAKTADNACEPDAAKALLATADALIKFRKKVIVAQGLIDATAPCNAGKE